MTSKLASLSTIGGNDPFSLVLGKKVEKPVEKKEHKKPSLKPGFFMDDKGRLGFDPEKKLVHESVRKLRGMAEKHIEKTEVTTAIQRDYPGNIAYGNLTGWRLAEQNLSFELYRNDAIVVDSQNVYGANNIPLINNGNSK